LTRDLKSPIVTGQSLEAELAESKESRMSRIKLLTLVVLVTLASSLVVAGAATAASVDNPRWATCAKKAGGKYTNTNCTKEGAGEFELQFLGEGEKQEVEAKAKGKQTFKLPSGNPVVCSALKLKKGSNVKGAKAPAPGRGEETFEYTECEVEKSAECKINKESSKKAQLATKRLMETLAYETKAGAEKEENKATLTVLEPAEGKVFAEFELSGSGCPSTGVVKVEGNAVVRNLSGGEHAEEQEFEGPESPISKYFLNSEGKSVEHSAELTTPGFRIPWIVRWTSFCGGLGIILIIAIFI
jgi:hypothetical protein